MSSNKQSGLEVAHTVIGAKDGVTMAWLGGPSPSRVPIGGSREKRAEVERHVASLLADGLVEETCSPWASWWRYLKRKW